jgi:hypothetical protein
MNDSRSDIERIVMQRVHLIRALRFAISSGVFSTLISVLALFGIGREVWVARVLRNAPPQLLDIPRFYFDAFLHTRLVVQALVVLVLASLIYVAYEIARAVAVMSARAELS